MTTVFRLKPILRVVLLCLFVASLANEYVQSPQGRRGEDC
jgi:hypothetical protein